MPRVGHRFASFAGLKVSMLAGLADSTSQQLSRWEAPTSTSRLETVGWIEGEASVPRILQQNQDAYALGPILYQVVTRDL